MSADEGRERARAAFAAAAAHGANVGSLMAELERGWARQDKPEEERTTTVDEITGGTWWTVPWGIWRDPDGSTWINPHYHAYDERGGTAEVKLEYHHGMIHAYVPAGCEIGTPWRDRQEIVLHEGN